MRGTSIVAMKRFRALAKHELEGCPGMEHMQVAVGKWRKYLDDLVLAELRYAMMQADPRDARLRPGTPRKGRQIHVI